MSIEQHDALRELINVICGNLLPLIGGGTAEFNIQIPFILAGASAAGEFGPANAVSNLAVGSGICLVALQLEGIVPAQCLAVNCGRMDGVAERVGT